MRSRISLCFAFTALCLSSGCGEASDSCSGDVQWALFDVAEFGLLCPGDSIEIREFDATTFLVDVNLQFRGVDGAGAVSGEWSLAFDSVVSAQDSAAEVPSFEQVGWWRVHASHWLAEDSASAVAALDGTEATFSATFTDAAGATVSSTLDLIAVAP